VYTLTKLYNNLGPSFGQREREIEEEERADTINIGHYILPAMHKCSAYTLLGPIILLFVCEDILLSNYHQI
jgi:hypothetical protein